MHDNIALLLEQAKAAWRRSDYETAATLLEDGVALSRRLERRLDLAFWFSILGDAAYMPQRDYRRAASICERGVALSNELEDLVGKFVTTHFLGVFCGVKAIMPAQRRCWTRASILRRNRVISWAPLTRSTLWVWWRGRRVTMRGRLDFTKMPCHCSRK